MENKIKWMPKEVSEMQIKIARLKQQGFFGKELENKLKELYNIEEIVVVDSPKIFN